MCRDPSVTRTLAAAAAEASERVDKIKRSVGAVRSEIDRSTELISESRRLVAKLAARTSRPAGDPLAEPYGSTFVPGSPTFWVQRFSRSDGALKPSIRIRATSEADALATAAAMVPTVSGTAALCITLGEEGGLAAATILATHGEIPDEFSADLLDHMPGM